MRTKWFTSMLNPLDKRWGGEEVLLGNLHFYSAPGFILSLRITEHRTSQAGVLSQKMGSDGVLPNL